MRIFSYVIDKSIHLLMLALGFFASIASTTFRGKFGILLGKVMYLIGDERRKIAFDNLKLAFPEKDNNELTLIASKSFENLGITFLEVSALRFIGKDKIKQAIRLDNYELINKALDKGNGLIMLSGHYANWEYLALAAGIYSNAPITVVVKKQKNQFVDSDVNQGRTKFGNKVVDMKKAARELIKALRNNQAVALLADQAARADKDILVDFFGQKSITFEAPAELALKFNTPIVVAFPVRNENFTYSAELKEIDFSDLEYSKEGVKELTLRHVKILEEQIREFPHLWAWQHRRWKNVHKV